MPHTPTQTLSEKIKAGGFKEVDDTPVAGDITNDLFSDDNSLSGRMKKAGIQPINEIDRSASPEELKNALDNMSPEQERSFIQKAGPQNIKNFLIGIGKGLVSTVKGAATISERLGAFGTRAGRERAREDPLAGRVIPERFTEAEGTAQKAGFATEQIAEFLISPGAKAKAAVLSGKGFLKFIQKSLAEGVEFGGRISIQEGELKPSAFALGAAFPAVTKPLGSFLSSVARGISPALRSIFQATTSVPEKALTEAAKFPNLVRSGFDKSVSATTVRREAVQAFKDLSSSAQTAFKSGLEELAKLSPRRGFSRTATGKFAGLKKQFDDIVQEGVGGLKKTFNQFRISTEKNILNFDKLNSSITNSAEQGVIQKSFDTIRRQKDFSVQGVQDVASRLNALTKFKDGERTVSSAVVSKIHDTYSKAIQKVYPELGKLRSGFATTKGVLKQADEVLNAIKGGVSQGNIKSIRSSVGKLTNLFKEDNDVYVDALRTLEMQTGVKFLSKLAGTEFQRISPGILRTSLAVGGVSALFHRTAALLLLPLFSPRAVGGTIVGTAKARELMSVLINIGVGAGKKIDPKRMRFIIDKIIQEKVIED